MQKNFSLQDIKKLNSIKTSEKTNDLDKIKYCISNKRNSFKKTFQVLCLVEYKYNKNIQPMLKKKKIKKVKEKEIKSLS